MKYIFLFFISILCLSQSANFVRLSQCPPEVLGFWRLILAALILSPFAYLKDRAQITSHDLKKEILWITASGFFFYLHLWSYSFSAQNTQIANCMIIFATNPLFTALGAFLFFKEKFSKRLFAAYLLAAFAVFLLVRQNLRFDPEHLKGDFSALISAALYSAYILSGHRVRKTIPNSSYASSIFVVAGICFLATTLVSGKDLIHYPSITWVSIAALVFLSTLLGHGLFTFLLKHLNINLMSCGKLLEPGLSAFIAWILFSEKITSTTLIALLCTVTSIFILFGPQIYEQIKRKKEPLVH